MILRLAAHHLDERAGIVLVEVDDDVRLYAQQSRQRAHAHRAADAVEVGKFMTHDQHLRRIAHKLGEGVRHDAGLDLRALLDLIAAAAEELEAEPVFDDRLIAAARERKLYGDGCVLQRLRERGRVHAEAEAYRGVDAGRAFDLMHLLNDGEFLRLQLLKAAALEHDEVSVALVAADDGLVILAPLVELVLDGVADIVFDAVGLVLDQLVHIVDDQHAGDGAGVFVLHADVVVLGHVHPVGDAHEGAVVPVLGADDVAVYLVLAAVHGQQARILGLTLKQPLAVEFRHEVGHARVKPRAAAAIHGEEHLVAPDDARIVQPESGDGQREIHQGVVFGVFRIVGHGFDVRFQLLCAAAAGEEGVDHQDEDDDALGHRKLVQLEKQGCRREEDEEDQVQSPARLGQPLQVFVHRRTSMRSMRKWV